MTNDLYIAIYRAIRVPQLSADPGFHDTQEWLAERVGSMWGVIYDTKAEWVGAADENGEIQFVARPGEWMVVAPSGRIDVRPEHYVRNYLSAVEHDC